MNPWRRFFHKFADILQRSSDIWAGWSAKPALICLAMGFGLLELSGSCLAWRGGLQDGAAATEPEPARTAEQWQAANQRLARKIALQRPAGPYLVIDTVNNQVTLRTGEEVLRGMRASCGSGKVLEDQASGRRWVFDTPRGEHRIRTKREKPVWIKPDWAFLEAGQPLPATSAERVEPGAMGDYALGLGNGYFIHGTLYSRMLGRNVSHGCVRLGDADLAHLYRTLPIGTRVFIF